MRNLYQLMIKYKTEIVIVLTFLAMLFVSMSIWFNADCKLFNNDRGFQTAPQRCL